MLILVPIIAMLALEFVMPGKKKICARFFLMMLVIVAALFLFLRSFLPVSWIDPEGEVVMRVHAQVEHLLHTKDWQHHPVIILEGGSVTQYGVNGALLETLLAKQGKPATVLQFSLWGANHFERLFMLRLFFEEVGTAHREELKRAPLFLLSEVFDVYDKNPFYLFRKEAYTHRMVTWAQPDNVVMTWRAWKASGLHSDEVSSWVLLEHILFNRFAVGIFSSMQPLDYRKKEAAFLPRTGIRKGFDYATSKKSLEVAMSSSPETIKQLPYAGWQFYYKKLFHELGGVCHSMVFYALPTLDPQQRAYQVAFAHSLPKHTTMLGPVTPTEMKSFLQEENWADEIHPQKKGAMLVTQWLAEEIVKQWPQIVATRWKE